MAAGYSALCFNAVVQVLQAAAVAQTIKVDPKVVLPSAAPMMGLDLPNVQIHLPSQPYAGDSWGGTSNLKNGFFKVEVSVLGEVLPEQSIPNGTPYGSSTQLGILVLSDQVQDALEADYILGQSQSVLRSCSPRVVDVASFGVVHGRNVADSRQIVSVISVVFKIRFFASQRS